MLSEDNVNAKISDERFAVMSIGDPSLIEVGSVPHPHLAMKKNGKPVDPESYLTN